MVLVSPPVFLDLGEIPDTLLCCCCAVMLRTRLFTAAHQNTSHTNRGYRAKQVNNSAKKQRTLNLHCHTVAYTRVMAST